MASKEKSTKTTIQLVDKALEVLEVFSELNEGVKISRLSERLNMNKSGVHRLLQVFKQRGYLEQRQKNGKYYLGMSAYMVGQNIVSNMGLLSTARPVMERLARKYNETVYLALPRNQEALLFDGIDSLHAVSVMSLKGRLYPLAECAAGDMLQAFSTAPGEDALCNTAQNDARLAMLKQQGYSMDVDRLGSGVVSLAVPLLNAERLAVGSLCFVGPDFRLTDEKINGNLLLPLIEAGHAISAKLGYFGYHLPQVTSSQR
ncbi:MAG: IclR family transcriptional regulator [Desulfuromonadales bacterium]|nr:IclR family transcriptional regulator [Desulfuromonadales bacterium]